MDQNQAAFELEALNPDSEGRPSVGLTDHLLAPERYLFEKYATEIAAGRVLDLGVGGGRTSRYLIPRSRSYRALDYAQNMIDVCRRNIPVDDPGVFAEGDARDLSSTANGEVDIVLFSYNGLDMVGPEDRMRVFGEVRRVLRTGGLFLFSSHSLHAFPFPDPEVQARNQHVDIANLRPQGWAMLVDYAWMLVTYYIFPDVQIAQLETAGFETLDAVDMRGEPFDFANPPTDWMVYFAARRR